MAAVNKIAFCRIAAALIGLMMLHLLEPHDATSADVMFIPYGHGADAVDTTRAATDPKRALIQAFSVIGDSTVWLFPVHRSPATGLHYLKAFRRDDGGSAQCTDSLSVDRRGDAFLVLEAGVAVCDGWNDSVYAGEIQYYGFGGQRSRVLIGRGATGEYRAKTPCGLLRMGDDLAYTEPRSPNPRSVVLSITELLEGGVHTVAQRGYPRDRGGWVTQDTKIVSADGSELLVIPPEERAGLVGVLQSGTFVVEQFTTPGGGGLERLVRFYYPGGGVRGTVTLPVEDGRPFQGRQDRYDTESCVYYIAFGDEGMWIRKENIQ